MMSRYQLRTTDVEGARAFYSALVPDAEIVLHEGRPHWLGHLGVDRLAPALRAFITLGATQLGPTRTAPDGETAILRDPGEAIIALTSRPALSQKVAWHVLNCYDAVRVADLYRDLFGWDLTDRLDLGPLGVYQQFAWRAGTPNVGSITDISARPGLHPHWLFHFHVAALAPAIDVVRDTGGRALPPIHLPNGERIAVCEDPQGAAFALHATG